jgi:hypothetical protein
MVGTVSRLETALLDAWVALQAAEEELRERPCDGDRETERVLAHVELALEEVNAARTPGVKSLRAAEILRLLRGGR